MPHDYSGPHSAFPHGRRALAPVMQASDLYHPELQAFYEFWHLRAEGRIAPARKNFDALELKRWLPHIQLVDIIESYMDIRYRVIGTWIVERFGGDDTGKTIAEIGVTEHSKEVRQEFLSPAKNKIPHSVIRPFYDASGAKEFSCAERLMLPLSTDGHTCDKVISGLYYLTPAI